MKRDEFDPLFDGCLDQIRAAIRETVGDRPHAIAECVEETRRKGKLRRKQWVALQLAGGVSFCDWICRFARNSAAVYSEGIHDTVFRTEVEACKPRIVKRIRKAIGSKADSSVESDDDVLDAEDSVQEVLDNATRSMWRAWKNHRSFRGDEFFAYFSKVADRKSVDWLRRRNRAKPIDPGVDIVGTDQGALERLLDTERLDDIGACIRRLPAESRFVLTFYYRKKLTDAQLNRLLGGHGLRAFNARQSALSLMKLCLEGKGYEPDHEEATSEPPRPRLYGPALVCFEASDIADRRAFHQLLVRDGGGYELLGLFLTNRQRHEGFQTDEELAMWLNSTLTNSYFSPFYVYALPDDAPVAGNEPVFWDVYQRRRLPAGQALVLLNSWMLVQVGACCFHGEQWMQRLEPWLSHVRHCLPETFGGYV